MVEIFIGILKGIPALRDIILQAVKTWELIQMGQYDNEAAKIKEELEYTTQKMKEAKTDEERILIHRIRARITNGRRV